MTLEELKEQQARAEMCDSAEIPGELLRELIRLAIIGKEFEDMEVIQ